jgi:hypothetical protein
MKETLTQDAQSRTEEYAHSYSLHFQEVYDFATNVGHIVLIIDN